jgi:hypothetical protein
MKKQEFLKTISYFSFSFSTDVKHVVNIFIKVKNSMLEKKM